MKMQRHSIIAVVSFLVVAGSAAPARAELYKKLWRGLNYALSPTLGNPQTGPFADQNIFRQRLIRNFAGDGWGYEFTRTFGTDSFGNSQQYDFGPVNASLQGVVHNRFDVNMRFVPEFKFQSDTNNAALNYNINSIPGLQTLQLSGNVNIFTQGTINALGFYNLRVNVSNTGNARADGWFLTENIPTDFDIGPINVSGNIFMDLASAVVTVLPNLVAGTVSNIPSAASAREKTEDAVAAVAGSELAQAELEQLIGQALIQAILSDALSALNPVELLNLPALLGLPGFDTQQRQTGATAAAEAVPEPTTLMMLLPPLAWAALRRRR